MADLSFSNSNKLLRKQKRCQAILSRSANVKCVDYSTPFIAICNAGLSTGLQKEAVLELALKYGRVLDVIMEVNKSYCFLKCENADTAANIFENIQGRAPLGQNSSPIYLTFVTEIPNVANPWQQILPEGLIVLKDFVNADEENILLEAVRTLNEPLVNNILKHRRVKHFGYEFLYGLNNVDPENPLGVGLPEECDILWKRLREKVDSSLVITPDQLTVNTYEPGQGIPPHVDTHSAFLDPIYSLSLESDIVMEFRQGNKYIPVILPQKSLLIMSGESRYAWTHGITSRQMDVVPSKEGGLTVHRRLRRTSLTFRRLRRDRCDCLYPELCDTFAAEIKTNEKQLASVAAQLEEQNVHKVYDEIANHFSETRYKPWPKVENFLKSFEFGSVILDVGCGNGKYLGVNSSTVQIGCDRSEGLLQVCLERKHHVLQCNCLSLPFRNDSIDGCISIAVIHHLASELRRLQAIQEMARILIPGGRCLIYVWAKNQQFNCEKSSYLHRNRNNRKIDAKSQNENDQLEENQSHSLKCELINLPIHMNRTQFQQQDVFVPWKLAKSSVKGNAGKNDTKKKEFLRYYHVFEESELVKLCLKVDCIEVERDYYDQGNWCIIFRKK